MKKVCYLFVLIGLCAGCNYLDLSDEEIEKLTATLSFDKENISFASAAANRTVDITSNSTWTATVSDEATWCTIDPTSGYLDGTITVNVEENTTTSDRSATITATAGVVKQTVTVTQAAAKATLTLDETSIAATSAATSYPIAVTSNVSWTATVSSNAKWCTISPTSGTNNGTITVSVAENTTPSSRSATITVTAGTITRTVTVTQNAANATLTLDKTSISAAFATAGYSIGVTSNSAWAVSSNAAWCTISQASGSGNGTITVNVAENITTSSRSATITVTDGVVTQTVTVTQTAPFKQPEMVTVAGGSTTLDDGTSVTRSSFQIGKYEVTQWLWLVVMDRSWPFIAPSDRYGEGDSYPMYYVSHDDIQTFLSALNTKTGKNYRLPTSAEWVYAAKGGQRTHNYLFSGSNKINDVGWCWDNIPSNTPGVTGYGTQRVGTKASNELGIFDMSGNVAEWCGAPDATGSALVYGGSWHNDSFYCVVNNSREVGTRDIHNQYIGFRLAHDVE